VRFVVIKLTNIILTVLQFFKILSKITYQKFSIEQNFCNFSHNDLYSLMMEIKGKVNNTNR